MPVKEKLSGISLSTLIPLNNAERRVTIKDEPLSSAPFIIPKNRKINSTFTGRIKELDYLRMLYGELITCIKNEASGDETQRKPIIAAIKGEAGIGKTRLFKEFISRIKNSNENKVNNFFLGSSLNTGQNPYGMFYEILREKVSKLGYKPESESNIAVNNFIKESLFKKALTYNKSKIPYVVLIEDMQWADESSLGALEHIINPGLNGILREIFLEICFFLQQTKIICNIVNPGR
ncbi:MAG: AAA family ATPase [Ignavibacteria bacterium]